MQWTTAYSESVHTYANTVNTHEGGTHEEGFRAALTKLVNDFARKQNQLKDKDENLTGDDVARGPHRRHLGQARRAPVRGPDQDQARQLRGQGLRPARHDRRVRRLARAPPQRGQARSSARRSRPRPPGWPPARRARPPASGCSSAAACPASCATARPRTPRSPRSSSSRVTRPVVRPCAAATRTTRRSCPIRGKILNVERARLDKALGNQEVQALISAFGTGIGEDFDIEKARYHKIVIMADADVDGMHIRTLLLTLLFRFMKPLIEAGYVYLAQPPLFRIKWSNAPHEFAFTDRERDAPDRRGPEQGPAPAQGQPDPALQGSGRDGLPGAVGDHDGPRLTGSCSRSPSTTRPLPTRSSRSSWARTSSRAAPSSSATPATSASSTSDAYAVCSVATNVPFAAVPSALRAQSALRAPARPSQRRTDVRRSCRPHLPALSMGRAPTRLPGRFPAAGPTELRSSEY